MISLNSPTYTLTLQAVSGVGNQGGRWVETGDTTRAISYRAASLFGEVKLTKHWRLIGGVDRFDRDETSFTGQYTRFFTGWGTTLEEATSFCSIMTLVSSIRAE